MGSTVEWIDFRFPLRLKREIGPVGLCEIDAGVERLGPVDDRSEAPEKREGEFNIFLINRGRCLAVKRLGARAVVQFVFMRSSFGLLSIGCPGKVYGSSESQEAGRLPQNTQGCIDAL